MYANSQQDDYPSLPWAGTIVASLFLTMLTVLSLRFSVLSPLLAPLSGTVLAGILLLHRTPLSLLAPLCVATAVIFTSPSAEAALLPLVALPLGVVTAYAVRCGFHRMKAIISAAAASGLVITVMLSAILFAKRISLGMYITKVKSEVVLWLTSHTVMTAEGVRTAVLTTQSADMLVSYCMLFAPAFLVCGLFLFGFVTTELLWRVLRLLDAAEDFLPNRWDMIPRRALAVLYLLSQTAVFLIVQFSKAEILYYAFYNATLIFMTPFAILGIQTLIRQYRHNESLEMLGRVAIAAFLFMVTAAGLYWLLTFAAFYGVYTVFRFAKASTPYS